MVDKTHYELWQKLATTSAGKKLTIFMVEPTIPGTMKKYILNGLSSLR